MFQIIKNMIVILAFIFISVTSENHRPDLYEKTTILDSKFIQILFKNIRDVTFHVVGRTGYKTMGKFLQKPLKKFPCTIDGVRGKNRPKSVHKLQPGDIDVIAAIGDSLTAASAAMSSSLSDLFMENRGLAWSIGGQWDWRNATTLPNILKVFNPKLVGYSRQDAYLYHPDSQFNLGEIGAVSADMPYMARDLVAKILQDRRVNYWLDWKMVTISMGGNDICSFVCTMRDPESLSNKHRIRLIETLRYLRDKLPRTFVNVVPIPMIDTVIKIKRKPPRCAILHNGECPCWVGHLYNQTTDAQERYRKIQIRMREVEEEVTHMKEFQGLQEFAVIFQPWSKFLNLTTNGPNEDLTLVAFDCFHMSQKGNAWAGVSLWNNLLEPSGQKSTNWEDPEKKFLCPTKHHPYFYTNENKNK